MNQDILLTVVIPAYNEEKNIRTTLEEISGYLNKKKFSYEIIVIDDGSKDKTFENTQTCSNLFSDFKVLKNDANKGKGYSVKRGILFAKGEYALFMDADNSTSIYEFDKFLPYLKEGYDAVIASRRLKTSNVEEPQPFFRAKMGQFYIFLARLILGLNLSDFNCGFKVYNTRTTYRIFELQKMNDWSFDVELLFLLNKYGLKIKEVPVRWIHKSESKVKPVKDAIKSFISILIIKLTALSRKYS
ncbi:MAG: glycosyltransferase family 2 protein [Candidatus Omnitrophota bacterium]|nr:glycosyltransferase family 2 protein [Candidatus Omnitrophota bacterium]